MCRLYCWKCWPRMGVRHMCGIPGGAINGLIDEIRRQDVIRFVHVRHEEAGAFAASAHAKLTLTRLLRSSAQDLSDVSMLRMAHIVVAIWAMAEAVSGSKSPRSTWRIALSRRL